jgi:hypothetical protein
MACRGAVAAKHLKVAQALIDGFSVYRALRIAGYSHFSSRNFRTVVKKSWPLREAIRLVREKYLASFVPRPRRTRYARRSVSFAVNTYCQSDIQAVPTNRYLHRLSEIERNARAVAEGRNLVPVRCSLCRGPLEGQDRWCPNCQRIES